MAWLSIILTINVKVIYGQDSLSTTYLKNTMVDELFTGSLSTTLSKLETKHKVSFEYDTEKYKNTEFVFRAFNNSLKEVIETICKENKLKYYIENNKIVLIGKNEPKTKPINTFTPKNAKAMASAPTLFNFNLSGSIKDNKTGESIPYATLYVKNGNSTAETNSDGYFTLQNIPTDTNTIIVSYLGYKKEYIKLYQGMNMNNIRIDLSEDEKLLNEVVVSGDAEALLKVPQEASVVQISPKQLAQLPNVGEKDVMRSFQLMPGVSASNESSSGLYVRGGTPDQNLVLYDGFTVYHVDHLYGFFSAFNANAIKDVKLYKGGFDAKYGGRLSSVTEITGKEGNQRAFNVCGEVSLLSANAYAELPLSEKINVLLAVRRSYEGPLYNKLFDKFNSTQQNSDPAQGGNRQGFAGFENVKATSYFYDINGKICYRPTEKDIISLSIYNGTDDLDNSQNIEPPSFFANRGINLNIETTDKTQYGNIGSSLKWGRKWNQKFFGSQIISFSNYYSNRDRSANINISTSTENRTIKNGTFEDNMLTDYTYKGDYTWDIKRNHAVGFGTHISRYDIAYSYAQSDTLKILDKKNIGHTATAYLQDKINIDNRLSITPGVRLTYYDVTSKPYIEPRFAANYNLTDKLKLKAASGLYYQFANRITREDILAGSRDFWLLSESDKIPVSSSQHYILGSTYESSKYVISAEVFYKNYQGLTEYTLRYNVNPNRISYTENFYNGIGNVKGLELLLQKKYGNLNGWIGYTLLNAQNKFDVYGKDYFPSNQDITNEYKIVGVYRLKRWTFSATWIYATGRPYTAPSGGYSVQLLDGTDRDYISVSDKNSRRLPDYHRLDLAANYDIQNGEGKSIGYIGVSVFNLYDRTNVWYKKYDLVDNEVIETNVNYLGITPNITLSLHLR
ncbi:MAG: TonB-dependent receptor [Cytophagales bacterium]|nr:TonB-dependent receptor [Cytophagales bacterium]